MSLRKNEPLVKDFLSDLQAGKQPLDPDELMADVRHGLYFEGMDSFSIDQWRLNFQFGGNAVWEIRNGKKAGMLKAALYQSQTPEFWNACDATCDQRYWSPHGVMNCGKGDPLQVAQMTHGAAPSQSGSPWTSSSSRSSGASFAQASSRNFRRSSGSRERASKNSSWSLSW